MLLTKFRDLPSCFWRALVLIGLALAGALVLSSLTACGDLLKARPQAVLPCPLPHAEAFETPAGILYVFDEANMQKMVERLEGVIAGTCLPLPAPAPDPSERSS